MQELLVAIGGARTPSLRAAPPVRPHLSRDYTDDEVKLIFSRALAIQAREPLVARSVMIEAAREVGLDERQIALAEEEIARAELGERDDVGSRKKSWFAFYRHLAAYLAASVFFMVVFSWTLWRFVVFGWGIGVVSHLASVVFPKEKRQGRRNAKRTTPVRAELVEEGAAKLLAGTRRARVKETPTAVATPTELAQSTPRRERV